MLVTAAAAALLLVPAAHAATPEQGEVGTAQPKVTWTGEAYGQPLNNGIPDRSHDLCIAPFCDSFTLTVKEAGALRLRLDAPGSAGFVEAFITYPDGTTENFAGNDADTFQEIIWKKPALGTYLVDIWPNRIYGLFEGDYYGEAELCPAPTPFAECFVPEEEEF